MSIEGDTKMLDYSEEQRNELEALEAIYPNELTGNVLIKAFNYVN